MSRTSSTSTIPSAMSANSRTQSLVREESFTHSFPAASSAGSVVKSDRKGLSPSTRALAKQAFELEKADPKSSDRTLLFFGGLQWLLDSTIESANGRKDSAAESRRPSLTEHAVRTFDILDKSSGRVVEVGSAEDVKRASDSNRTNAWLSDQMKAD